MKYDLQLFDKLVSNNRVEEPEEVNIIIDQIKQTAFSLRTEQEIKLYIQNHQLALIENKKYDSIYMHCDTVLYFIETQFYNFVNDKLSISDLGKSKFLNKYSEVIQENQCLFRSCLNEKMCMYIQPLTQPEKCDTCTIHCLRYITQFWDSWQIDFKTSFNTLKEDTIISYLIAQNFNAPDLFKYLTGAIVGELHLDDDPFIQEQILVSHAKRINMIPAKMSMPFRFDYPNIKLMLENWLNNEIKQCRKKQKKYDPQQQSILPKDGYKIETSMSVAQTAYLFKLLSKSGIITNKVQMDILHVLSEKFRSKKSDIISFDSLHNKYYNIEDRTKDSVREILKELLKQME